MMRWWLLLCALMAVLAQPNASSAEASGSGPPAGPSPPHAGSAGVAGATPKKRAGREGATSPEKRPTDAGSAGAAGATPKKRRSISHTKAECTSIADVFSAQKEGLVTFTGFVIHMEGPKVIPGKQGSAQEVMSMIVADQGAVIHVSSWRALNDEGHREVRFDGEHFPFR